MVRLDTVGRLNASSGRSVADSWEACVHTSVLHTITSLDVGGAQVMLARFLGQVDQNRFSTSVLSLLSPGPVAANVEYTRSGLVSLDMTERPRPRDVVRLTRSIRRAAPDLLHGWMYHGNVAATLGSMLGLNFSPVIWSIHHTVRDLADEKPLTRQLIRLSARLSRRTSAISYCSRVAADDHERLGFDPRRRVVIPNGTDCDQFSPSADAGAKLRRLFGLPPGRLMIGHVARFHPMKDQVSLVRAISRLLEQGYDVQGIFIGEGHADGPVRRTARELGIDDRITTPGIRADIADLMPGFDVYALCSAWGEAFSLAVGEAMASGVPAVVTAVGDSGWLVGDSGVVVPPGDSEALAAGLIRLVSLEPAERRALGQQARRRVMENFSLSLYVGRHLELYEAALGRLRHIR
ncbi:MULTISPECIES: glycosyltransferase [unclassified Mesorhizobium]|uniref:glycosyltransferase n=1 Tax=unclassified Mesorhizobium TaxID=325217 RepID=UPI0011278BDB|nr:MULTISPECIES: glycosyltransferase [unclassified Mesorhizobium]TPJ47153.1 glycosyltransferase [Mesorhizobium sp. B2-6-4]TPL06018.1 glycosyltransferase [Mesorhizobium sp. B2-4-11]TPM91704.1 glycosyltransferase [Mesorhizobium sp. B2-1-5]